MRAKSGPAKEHAWGEQKKSGRSGERVSKKRERVGRKGFCPPPHPIPLLLIFPLFRSFSPVRERLEKERKRLLRRLTACFSVSATVGSVVISRERFEHELTWLALKSIFRGPTLSEKD